MQSLLRPVPAPSCSRTTATWCLTAVLAASVALAGCKDDDPNNDPDAGDDTGDASDTGGFEPVVIPVPNGSFEDLDDITNDDEEPRAWYAETWIGDDEWSLVAPPEGIASLADGDRVATITAADPLWASLRSDSLGTVRAGERYRVRAAAFAEPPGGNDEQARSNVGILLALTRPYDVAEFGINVSTDWVAADFISLDYEDSPTARTLEATFVVPEVLDGHELRVVALAQLSQWSPDHVRFAIDDVHLEQLEDVSPAPAPPIWNASFESAQLPTGAFARSGIAGWVHGGAESDCRFAGIANHDDNTLPQKAHDGAVVADLAPCAMYAPIRVPEGASSILVRARFTDRIDTDAPVDFGIGVAALAGPLTGSRNFSLLGLSPGNVDTLDGDTWFEVAHCRNLPDEPEEGVGYYVVLVNDGSDFLQRIIFDSVAVEFSVPCF